MTLAADETSAAPPAGMVLVTASGVVAAKAAPERARSTTNTVTMISVGLTLTAIPFICCLLCTRTILLMYLAGRNYFPAQSVG